MPNVAAGSSTAYTYAQLEGLWIQAGGPRSLAPIAAAIALAESAGDPTATNPDDNGGRQSSYGLWQISNGTHSPPAPNWANPHVNAGLAVAKWKAAGNSFAPWGTYESGAYKQYLSNSTTPQQVPGSAGSSGSTAGPGCLMQLPSLFGGGCAFRDSQARAVVGGLIAIGGGLILLVGLVAVLARANVGPAIQIASEATPAGRAGTVARNFAGVTR